MISFKLETERLILREAEPADARFFIDLMNSPGWLTFIGNRGIKTEADALGYVKNSLQRSYAENGFGLYVMTEKETENKLGICGIVKRDSLDLPDLGFALLPEYEGRGYVFESCTAILDYAVEKLNMERMLAITVKENLRSRNLLERLDFELIRQEEKKDNQEILLIYSKNLNH